MKRSRASHLIACAALISLAQALAGPLDPPGSPLPTPGPEPRTAINEQNTPGNSAAFFRITESGSYYLTDNVVNPLLSSTRHGIVVEASNVTIDLNGFTLDGYEPLIVPFGEPQPQGLAPQTTGILASGGGLAGITVVNGFVRDWTNEGLNLTTSDGSAVEGVRAFGNGDRGLSLGQAAVVRRCIAVGNGGNGIAAGNGSVIEECVARDNGEGGIMAGSGSVVSDSAAQSNGATGIFVFGGSTVAGCSAYANLSYGIHAAAGSVVLNNACTSNATGIRVTAAARVEGNLAHSNTVGYETATGGNLIVRNQASGTMQDHFGQVTGGNMLGTIRTSLSGAGPWDNLEP